MLPDTHFKNIYRQFVVSQEATRECPLPKQGNKPRKKMQDRNKVIRDLTHSQSEGHPMDSHDRTVQEDRCTSGPESNQPRLEQQETEGSRSQDPKKIRQKFTQIS